MEENIVPRLDRDKFQAMCLILEDTIRSYFYGAHAPVIIINAHACRQIIHDLATYHTKHNGLRRVEFPSKRKVLAGKSGTDKFLRDIANNLRHADKNSNEVFPTSFPIAHSYLALTILDFLELKKQLLAYEIVKARDVKCYADLGWDRELVTIPKKIGPIQISERPISVEEEKQKFRNWKPVIDRLSVLFVEWHSVTQPLTANKTQSVSIPFRLSFLDSSRQMIDERSKLILDRVERDYNFLETEEQKNAYVSSMVRFNSRRLMVTEMQRQEVDFSVSSFSDYFTAKVKLQKEDDLLETNSVPMEGKVLHSQQEASRKQALKDKVVSSLPLEFRLVISS